MQDFEYVAPRTLKEVLTLMAEADGGCSVLAGGTDLIVKMKRGTVSPTKLVDIKRVEELKTIGFNSEGELEIGAAVTLNQVASYPGVAEKFPVLHQAIGSLGSVQVRNRGTLVGNICNASPAADTAPALLLYDARVEITGLGGSREVPLHQFFAGPGKTVLKPVEIVTRVFVPQVPGADGVYIKLARRQAVDLAIVSAAALAFKDRSARLALGAVAPTPVRLFNVEAEYLSKGLDEARIRSALPAILDSVSPIDDIRASREYRVEMVRVLSRRALEEALKKVS